MVNFSALGSTDATTEIVSFKDNATHIKRNLSEASVVAASKKMCEPDLERSADIGIDDRAVADACPVVPNILGFVAAEETAEELGVGNGCVTVSTREG